MNLIKTIINYSTSKKHILGGETNEKIDVLTYGCNDDDVNGSDELAGMEDEFSDLMDVMFDEMSDSIDYEITVVTEDGSDWIIVSEDSDIEEFANLFG